jgi:hypothetical protein
MISKNDDKGRVRSKRLLCAATFCPAVPLLLLYILAIINHHIDSQTRFKTIYFPLLCSASLRQFPVVGFSASSEKPLGNDAIHITYASPATRAWRDSCVS